MLAELGSTNDLKRKNFYFEPKWDGTRAIVYKRSRKIKILNRRGNWIEYRYPELSNLNEFIKAESCILDGEIVVFDDTGKPNFHLLQEREQTDKDIEIEIKSKEYPATYIVFDVIEVDGKRLTDIPLRERKTILEKIVKNDYIIRKSLYTENGKKLFSSVKKLNLEGVMAKQKDGCYLIGKRSDLWLKIKYLKSIDCVIIGYREGKGRREGKWGALCLALYDKKSKKYFYVGRVGTGWDDKFVEKFYPILKRLKSKQVTVRNPPKNWQEKKIHWLKPKLVCEINFLEVTKNKELRAPSFKGLRKDKKPKECLLSQL